MVVSGPLTVIEHTVDILIISYRYVLLSEILNIIGRLGTKHKVNNNAVRMFCRLSEPYVKWLIF